jgi:hypothetical protein
MSNRSTGFGFAPRTRTHALCAALLFCVGCGNGAKSTPPPVCGQACQDGVALRGLRTMIKIAYDGLVQGKPVGAQDVMQSCIYQGTVHIHGLATVNALQGDTFLGDSRAVPPVPFTYDFASCRWIEPTSATAEENFDLTLSGSVGELGTLSQQPTANTVLGFTAGGLHLSGTVYDAPIPYDAFWNLKAGQTGNSMSACICTPDGDGGTDAGATGDAGVSCGVDSGFDCRTASFTFND